MYCQNVTSINPIKINLDFAKNEIDENWQKFTKWRPTKENASLCRKLESQGDRITVTTDVTYKDVVGLRWHQNIPSDKAPFQVVTAIGLVRTSDGQLVLIPRDSGDWEPALECPGGFVRANHLQNGKVSVDDFIKKRVVSDMQLTKEIIDSSDFLTIYDAKEILEYMLVYQITLTISAKEIQQTHPEFVTLPQTYKTSRHNEYTSISLHPPTRGAIDTAYKYTTNILDIYKEGSVGTELLVKV